MMKTETLGTADENAGHAARAYYGSRPATRAARGDPMDRGLITNANHALSWLIGVPGVRLLISVENRWVTLAGQVDWDYQRCAAERTTSQLRGVAGVHNLLTLKSRMSAHPATQPAQTA